MMDPFIIGMIAVFIAWLGGMIYAGIKEWRDVENFHSKGYL